MCLDPTIFGTLFGTMSTPDFVVAALLGLWVIIPLIYEIYHSTPRRSRTLRRYREDVHQLQQAAQRERKAAAAECLDDVYRLIRKR